VDLDVLTGQSDAEHCFSRPRVTSDLVWGNFEAWSSTRRAVLIGQVSDVVLVGLGLWGNLEP